MQKEQILDHISLRKIIIAIAPPLLAVYGQSPRPRTPWSFFSFGPLINCPSPPLFCPVTPTHSVVVLFAQKRKKKGDIVFRTVGPPPPTHLALPAAGSTVAMRKRREKNFLLLASRSYRWTEAEATERSSFQLSPNYEAIVRRMCSTGMAELNLVTSLSSLFHVRTFRPISKFHSDCLEKM